MIWCFRFDKVTNVFCCCTRVILTLTLYLSSDRPSSLIPFNIELPIIMTSFLLSILEFISDDCLDGVLDNDSDSDDDTF